MASTMTRSAIEAALDEAVDVDELDEKHMLPMHVALPLHCGACRFATFTVLPERVAVNCSPRKVNEAVLDESQELPSL